jgi:uncharacterized membrane protein
LGQYNEVLDNGAERLFEWAKDESEHRRGLEKQMTDSEISVTERGPLCHTCGRESDRNPCQT